MVNRHLPSLFWTLVKLSGEQLANGFTRRSITPSVESYADLRSDLPVVAPVEVPGHRGRVCHGARIYAAWTAGKSFMLLEPGKTVPAVMDDNGAFPYLLKMSTLS